MPAYAFQTLGTIMVWIKLAGGAILIAVFLIANRLPRSPWGGLRFSYTLADDEVWRKVHDRHRWWFLIIAIVCFLHPMKTFDQLLTFSAIVGVLLIAMIVSSFVYARAVYRDRFGTTKVVTKGLLKYEPPPDAVRSVDQPPA